MGALRETYYKLVKNPVKTACGAAMAYAALAFGPRVVSSILNSKPVFSFKYLEKLQEDGGQIALNLELAKAIALDFKDLWIMMTLLPTVTIAAYLLRKYTYQSEYFIPSKLFQKEQTPKKKQLEVSLASSFRAYAYQLSHPITFSFSKDWNKRISAAKKVLSHDPRYIDCWIILVEAHAKLGNLEKLCIESGKMGEIVARGFAKPDAGGIASLKYLLKKNSLEDRVVSASLRLALGEYESAIEQFNELADEKSPEMKALAAKMISSISDVNYVQRCSARADKLWKQVVDEIAPTIKLEDRVGESKSKVCRVRYNKFFENTIIFKAKENREELEQEKKMTQTLDDVLVDNPRCFVPKPLSITEKPVQFGNEKLYVYATLLESGSTLLEKIEQGNYLDSIKEIAKCLGTIHAKTPKESTNGMLPVAQTLYFKKLKNPEFGISRDVQRAIIKNFRPVYDSITKANWVYNKDAHPENWLIDKNNNIIVLDCEKSWLVPQQFDLANLFEYGNYLTDEQKKDIIENHYIPAYSSETSSAVGVFTFNLRYLNSVVYRALSLCSAWSSNDRQSMWPRRMIVLDNALHAIDRIKNEHAEYCSTRDKHQRSYSESYESLKGALLEIKNEMSSSQ